MKLLTDMKLLFKRSFIETLRNPVWVAVGLSTPLLYLALFTPLLDNFAGGPGFPTTDVLNVFLPGILALMAFGSGTGAGFGVIFELSEGVTERLRVTPVSRLALLLAPILAGVVWLFIFSALVVAVAIPFGFTLDVPGMLVAFVLLAMLMSVTAAFSVSVALITREISSLAAVVNGINLPILLLSGVLLPISLAPAWMSVIAHFNPMYYVVEANRVLAAGNFSDSSVGLAFLVMVPLMAVTFFWAIRVYAKAVS